MTRWRHSLYIYDLRQTKATVRWDCKSRELEQRRCCSATPDRYVDWWLICSADESWWWAKRNDRGGPGHHLIETAQYVCYGQMYSTGRCLIYLQQRFLRLSRGLPYLWQCSLRFASGSLSTSTSRPLTWNHIPWILLTVRYCAAFFCTNITRTYYVHVPAFGYD